MRRDRDPAAGAVAVVGAGMAAARFAERFHALGGRGEVTLYGAEPAAPYNRVLLTDVLTGRYGAEALTLPYGAAVARTGCEVTAVDPGARVLRLADGTRAAYDALVLATGAEPVLPPVRGLRGPDGSLREGVHVFRTLDDCRRLAGAAASAERAVVIGGGVLGVSAARALTVPGRGRRLPGGLPVEIVQLAPHLAERHLDAQAAALLRHGLAALGVAVSAGSRARALRGTGRVTGVELACGRVLDADLVVLACGVRPRTGPARAAGLPVRTGVVVDDALACAPGVYAIGDCAEHRGVAHGTALAAWDQADVLAARLSGADPGAVYRGSRPLARLTAGPLEYAAFGETGGEGPGLDVLRLADATRGAYRKLVLRGDRLVGGILLGDPAAACALSRAYERDDPLPVDPLSLLITRGASR
ncbi:FAD-dependent oxidoreductase [Streptomyces sp. HU2014]|uniref:NAD(P)/FAD-dependent oxidoreductase n=1 Tax=Streptomyces sp. HU2014 TaxID=2939414 RepID=UPI0024B3BFD0|nr:FAD-dependent oxidoreductase [Streptomyces sp. HU2014]